MKREIFDDYIARFNARDVTAFEQYLTPDMEMLNGALQFRGIDGMKTHYVEKIWPYFNETLNVLRFVANNANLAVEMRTEFIATQNANTIFGSVLRGEQFTYHGVIFYDIRDDKFSRIQVAYNSFTNTKPDGCILALGLPH